MSGPFVANTDLRWFKYLRGQSVDGRLDEANFWMPKAQEPPARLADATPFFFRLKSPANLIVGYGFFASFRLLRLQDAWTMYGDRNGDATAAGFFDRIRQFRLRDMSESEAASRLLGCVSLIHLVFWPDEQFIPWGEERGWKPNIVQGRTERDPVNQEILLHAMQADTPHPPAEFAGRFHLVDADERDLVTATIARREGQGSFRARLLDAYSGSCAITGEHTEPVLEAAHIQPYLGPRSNHVQNGLLLTQEFHTLFDLGYVAIDPDDLTVRVSPRLKKDFGNGRRYASFDGQPILHLPDDPRLRPSAEALEWHRRKMFKAG